MDRHKYLNIHKWTSRGVISDDFDKLYENHMSINNCELCKVEFNKYERMKWRCLDHDHKTGLYRQTICNKCNTTFDRKVNKNNKLNHKNISFSKRNNIYIYEKMIDRKRIRKGFKTLTEALCFKYIQILKYQAKSI